MFESAKDPILPSPTPTRTTGKSSEIFQNTFDADRMMPPSLDHWNSRTVIAVSPSGVRYGPYSELPCLPPPKMMVVGVDILWIDGWEFQIVPFRRKVANWFYTQARSWHETDPSPANKAQIFGVADAIATRVRDARNPEPPEQLEFNF